MEYVLCNIPESLCVCVCVHNKGYDIINIILAYTTVHYSVYINIFQHITYCTVSVSVSIWFMFLWLPVFRLKTSQNIERVREPDSTAVPRNMIN